MHTPIHPVMAITCATRATYATRAGLLSLAIALTACGGGGPGGGGPVPLAPLDTPPPLQPPASAPDYSTPASTAATAMPAPFHSNDTPYATTDATTAPAQPARILVHAAKTTSADAITGYSVNILGANAATSATVQSATSPIAVPCPNATCTGFQLQLHTHHHSGATSTRVLDVLIPYHIHQIYDGEGYAIKTEFRGSFVYNASQRSVHNLQGDLSEVMAGTGTPQQPWPMGMPLLRLTHQLAHTTADDGQGLLVTSFLHDHTRTLSTDLRDGGAADGWTPGAWAYYGYHHGQRTQPNPGNAYVMAYIPLDTPTTALTAQQLQRISYADCAPEGMMGDDCMTGGAYNSRTGQFSIGSMGGYPDSQTITRLPTP